MLFDKYINESDEEIVDSELEDADIVDAAADPDSPEAIEAMAREVEQHMVASALESATFFEGGSEVIRNFTESAEVQSLLEARKMGKRTILRIGKSDDLVRRQHLACLVLAKEHKDPLFNKLALNRVKEKQLRAAIFKKYGNKAATVAKKSQVVHIKAMRKMPAIKLNLN